MCRLAQRGRGGAHHLQDHNLSMMAKGGGTQLFVVLLLLVIIPLNLAVDHNKFRKCQDTDFCKRNRALQPAPSVYHVVAGSVKSSPDRITGEIVNTYNNAHYTMDITTYPDRILRLQINEKAALKPRYPKIINCMIFWLLLRIVLVQD